MKNVKRLISVILVALLFAVLTFTIVFAANIVTNGDFSSLMGAVPDHWTPDPGITFIADGSGSCAVGQAEIEATEGGLAYQCIQLISHGTDPVYNKKPPNKKTAEKGI